MFKFSHNLQFSVLEKNKKINCINICISCIDYFKTIEKCHIMTNDGIITVYFIS